MGVLQIVTRISGTIIYLGHFMGHADSSIGHSRTPDNLELAFEQGNGWSGKRGTCTIGSTSPCSTRSA
jgi:hypothetical protein